MKKNLFLIFLVSFSLIIMIIGGCGSNNPPTASATPTNTALNTPTPSATSTVSPSPSTSPVTTIYSNGKNDGYITKSWLDQNTLDTNSEQIKLGGTHTIGTHLSTWDFTKVFLEFDLSQLSNKKIKTAKLVLCSFGKTNYPAKLGNLYLDWLDYAALEKNDFDLKAFESVTIDLKPWSIDPNFKYEVVEITTLITNVLKSNKNSCQLRLRREKNYLNNEANYDIWYSGDAQQNRQPRLVITY